MNEPRIKNDRMRHSWTTTGGWDPELDGPEAAWGRKEITCRTCGEIRRVWNVPNDDPLISYGCTRPGDPDKWQPEDYLIHVSGRLDHFDRFLPDGRVFARNLGGGEYADVRGNYRPCLGQRYRLIVVPWTPEPRSLRGARTRGCS